MKPFSHLAKSKCLAYRFRMKAPIKTTGIHSTKPNGGYKPRHADISRESAGRSMQEGDFTGAISLINAGVHPDSIHTPYGQSALMRAIARGDALLAARFLDAGANPNRPEGSEQESTYLGVVLAGASSSEHQPILTMLAARADLQLACSPSGELPLSKAVSLELEGPVKILAQAGGDPFACDASGESALSIALGLESENRMALLSALFPAPPSAECKALIGSLIGKDDVLASHWFSNLTTKPNET